jgi:hypothetical protein
LIAYDTYFLEAGKIDMEKNPKGQTTNTTTTTKVLVYLLLSFLTCIMVVFLTSIPPTLSIPETCDLCNNNTENLLPITSIVIPKNSNSFFTYTDNIYGIKVRYAYDWSIDGTNYPHGVGGLQIVAFYLPDIVKGFPFLRIGIDNLSKEFGHLPVSINDYFDRSLKNKKILQVFLTLSLLKQA